MHLLHKIVLDCSSIPAEECSDAIIVALEHGPDFKLRADKPDDTVHGSVTINHNSPPEAHEITVDVYETDEAPDARIVHGKLEGRESYLKRPSVMPTDSILRTRLDRL